MLKSVMKQNCKPLSQPRVLNGPHFKTWTRPEPEFTNPNPTCIFKPDSGRKGKFAESGFAQLRDIGGVMGGGTFSKAGGHKCTSKKL